MHCSTACLHCTLREKLPSAGLSPREEWEVQKLLIAIQSSVHEADIHWIWGNRVEGLSSLQISSSVHDYACVGKNHEDLSSFRMCKETRLKE
jgi:hypothetical protein